MGRQEESKNLKASDYERIGRAIEAVVTSGYQSKRRLITANFIRGIFFGLGVTIGASLIVGILLWVLTLFNDIPFIGDLLQNVEDTINEAQQQ